MRRSQVLATGIFRLIENPNYSEGMFTSILAGIRHLRPEHEGFLIMPVDIPLVRPFTVRRILEAASQFPDRIIYPVFNNKRGHPPLIPATLIPQILDWNEEGGLKAFLSTQEDRAIDVVVPDSNIHLDMDDPADYQTILEETRRLEIPSEKECEAVLVDVCHVQPEVIRHCRKVAEVADLMGKKLSTAGFSIDLELIRAAALLHDIAKGQTDHAIAGGKILREMGLGKTAEVVAVHTDLAGDDQNISLEMKIVYLADKFVNSDRLVTIEERYSSSLRLFGSSSEAKANITRKLTRALETKQELENLLGCALETFIRA